MSNQFKSWLETVKLVLEILALLGITFAVAGGYAYVASDGFSFSGEVQEYLCP